jgi:hypothetical protein
VRCVGEGAGHVERLTRGREESRRRRCAWPNTKQLWLGGLRAPVASWNPWCSRRQPLRAACCRLHTQRLVRTCPRYCASCCPLAVKTSAMHILIQNTKFSKTRDCGVLPQEALAVKMMVHYIFSLLSYFKEKLRLVRSCLKRVRHMRSCLRKRWGLWDNV